MVWPIHVLWWMATAVWCIALWITPEASIWSLVFAPIISQLPDLDQEVSHISNTIFFSNIWMMLRDSISWHREETHTLFATAIFGIMITIPILYIFNFQTVILLTLVYFSHLFLDLFNKQGLKLFYFPKINENAERYTIWNFIKKIIYKFNRSDEVVTIVEKVKFFKYSFPVWDTVTYCVFAIPSFFLSLFFILLNSWFFSWKVWTEINLLHSNVFIFLGFFSFLILSKNPLLPPQWEVIRFLKSVKENTIDYSNWDLEALHYIFVSSNFTILMLSLLFLFSILTSPTLYWEMFIQTFQSATSVKDIFVTSTSSFSIQWFFEKIFSWIWHLYWQQLIQIEHNFK